MDQAIRLKPRTILLCVGTNDTTAPHYSEEETVQAIAEMIDRAQDKGIRVVLTLVPQRSRPSSAIDSLNARLAALHPTAINLNPTLAANGSLLAEYTTDGVHLTPAAYGVWAVALREHRR
jgi:lysophospholipase L1-like esterase